MKTLIIDNYDSYTFNLSRLIEEASGVKPIVVKNDQVNMMDIFGLDFDNVVISSGSGKITDENLGISVDIIKYLDKPILGIGLGQLAIFKYNCGSIVKAKDAKYAVTEKIFHTDANLFKGLPPAIDGTRYHSHLCKNGYMNNFQVDAYSEDGEVMAISHQNKPIYGLQFDPSSSSSEYGKEIIKNFLSLTEEFYNKQLTYEIIENKINTEELYDKLYDYDPTTLWLDSSRVEKGLSRFSIFGISSSTGGHTLKYDVNTNTVEEIFGNQNTGTEYNTDIFSFLKENRITYPHNHDLPFDFQLGYIGYFGYELKAITENVKNKHQSNYPDSYLKYCDRALVYDHLEENLYALAFSYDSEWIEEIKTVVKSPVKRTEQEKNKKQLPEISFVQDRENYIKDVEYIKDLINNGSIYQVCLTNRLDIKDNIDGKDYYQHLRNASPGQYSGYLPLDSIDIACSSMELFLKVDSKGTVISKPIKGTIRRGDTDEEDQLLIDEMKNDKKSIAENLMIVDLLLNDLSKFCQKDTVKIEKLMDVETYKTLHQLVTTVSGKKKPEIDVIDIIKNTFPGGSMTGSPKRKALDILDNLEKTPRGIYSGIIGYISNTSTMDFNVVIRTGVIEKDKTTLGLGGAIVLQSDSQLEFDEVELKAMGALKALQSYYNSDEEINIKGAK